MRRLITRRSPQQPHKRSSRSTHLPPDPPIPPSSSDEAPAIVRNTGKKTRWWCACAHPHVRTGTTSMTERWSNLLCGELGLAIPFVPPVASQPSEVKNREPMSPTSSLRRFSPPLRVFLSRRPTPRLDQRMNIVHWRGVLFAGGGLLRGWCWV